MSQRVVKIIGIDNSMVQKLKGKMDRTLFFCILLIMTDVIYTGYGHWFMIGPLSIRMMLWILCFLLSIVELIIMYRTLDLNETSVALIGFIVLFIFQSIRGFYQNDLSVLINDVRGYSWFALFIPSYFVFTSQKKVNFFIKYIAYSTTIYLSMLFLIYLIVISNQKFGFNLIRMIEDLQLISVSKISDTLYRFSTGTMLFGIFPVIYFLFRYINTEKYLFRYAIYSSIVLSMVVLSFTRSYYFGVSISVLISVIYLIAKYPYKKKLLLLYILTIIIMMLFLLSVMGIIYNSNYLFFAINRTFPSLSIFQSETTNWYIDLTAEGDSLRGRTHKGLVDLFMENPIFGNGLGSAISFRDFGRVENSHLDLLQKTGVVSYILFHFPLFAFLIILLRIKTFNGEYSIEWILFLGMVCFFIVSFYNPIMNSSIGLCLYSIVIGIVLNIRSGKYLFDMCSTE